MMIPYIKEILKRVLKQKKKVPKENSEMQKLTEAKNLHGT